MLFEDKRVAMTLVCEDIANGMSVRQSCKREDRPGLRTIMRWLDEDETGELRQQYARAREIQADYYADEIVEIVDTEDDAAKARVRMDARRWIASKLHSKKYGDKVAHEHGSDPERPMLSVLRIVGVRPDSKSE